MRAFPSASLDSWKQTEPEQDGIGCVRCHSLATCTGPSAEDLCDECGGEAFDVAADTASQDEAVDHRAAMDGESLLADSTARVLEGK